MMPNKMDPTMYQTPGHAWPSDSSEFIASMGSMLVGLHHRGRDA